MIRKMAVVVAGLVFVSGLVVATALPAFAQQHPVVSNLKGFSPEANYMSLPGYLRWLEFQATGQWLTYQEAARIVADQVKGATH